MTSHDPMCLYPDGTTVTGRCVYCVVIANARADERARIAQAIEAACGDRQPCPWCMAAARIARAGDSDV